MKVSTCRSCGAEIFWALTESGRRMPLDAEPAERPAGLFRLQIDSDGASIAARSVSALYRSHFSTCPNAAEHRRS